MSFFQFLTIGGWLTACGLAAEPAMTTGPDLLELDEAAFLAP
jgi:hypothetical protein